MYPRYLIPISLVKNPSAVYLRSVEKNPIPGLSVGSFSNAMRSPDPKVERIARVLHDQYKLDRIAPGHCTGEPEFAALKKTFGDHYLYAGVESVIDLPK
jgi:7,8-dihydropterin-6-yl-methyl-4-(beta-D-ribofuranosyl)aminobenzene 5'-phosphate synthase